ncbi:MAG: thiol:disulfide interchange protein DsbA/DsbL [Pseudomonadales bacterium]|nr:thiol:disulfide interchange protein DsbA/DsbL [Pseudomonadales bacterium]
MKKLIQLVSAFTLMSFLATTAFAQEDKYVEGEHYRLLKKPIPTFLKEGEIGVIWEVFSYSCGHCNAFEPIVKSFLESKPDNVVFEHVTVYWNNPFFEAQDKAFYAAKFLKAPEESHDAIFRAIHKNRVKIGSVKDFAKIYAKFGVDEDKLIAMSESFAVQSRLLFAETVTRDGEVKGTPNIVVNGKYLVTGDSAGSNANILDVALFIVQKEAE